MYSLLQAGHCIIIVRGLYTQLSYTGLYSSGTVQCAYVQYIVNTAPRPPFALYTLDKLCRNLDFSAIKFYTLSGIKLCSVCTEYGSEQSSAHYRTICTLAAASPIQGYYENVFFCEKIEMEEKQFLQIFTYHRKSSKNQFFENTKLNFVNLLETLHADNCKCFPESLQEVGEGCRMQADATTHSFSIIKTAAKQRAKQTTNAALHTCNDG